jgi:AcrR family transcriptional regulator
MQDDPEIVEAAEAEALGDSYGDQRTHQILVRELGADVGRLLSEARRAQEAWEETERADEGLRERKRRLTRQRISDIATVMFAARGFDNVKVSEVADVVGVSEKTIYNYFPTKESMVLDLADESVERMARTLREREPGESVTSAALRALRYDHERMDRAPDELQTFLPRFAEMFQSTPSLRAAWRDIQNQIAEVAAQELARGADVDPKDPEPMIAGHALAGIGQIALESRVRHIEAGLRGQALHDAVNNDIERAARLLDTGLWSFNLLAQGHRKQKQLQEAAVAAEEARKQVLKALRQARVAWQEIRGEAQERAPRNERDEVRGGARRMRGRGR